MIVFSIQKKLELFQDLSHDEHLILNQNQYQISYKKGELIFKQGAPCTHILYIVEGFGNMFFENGKNNITIKFLSPGSIVLCSGMFVDSRHHYSIKALKETKVCFIKIENIKTLLEQNKMFSERFLAEINKNMNYAYEKLNSINNKNCEYRIAEVLCFFLNHIYTSRRQEIPISKAELVEYTGLPKESVKRVVNQLVKKEIVCNTRSKIEIIKPDSLKMIVDTV